MRACSQVHEDRIPFRRRREAVEIVLVETEVVRIGEPSGIGDTDRTIRTTTETRIERASSLRSSEADRSGTRRTGDPLDDALISAAIILIIFLTLCAIRPNSRRRVAA